MRKKMGGLLLCLALLSACHAIPAQPSPTLEPTPTEPHASDPVATETIAPGALTEEELRWFEEVFFKPDANNIRNVFGRPDGENIYRVPQDINLIELFYDGSRLREEVQATGAEINELIINGAFPEMVNELSQEYVCSVFRVTRDEMDEVLLKYTGLTLEETNQVGLDQLPYLEEYDAYYWCHGDVGYPGPLTILSRIREGSTIKIYQLSWDNVLYCLTLEQQPEGNYWFASNLPVPVKDREK